MPDGQDLFKKKNQKDRRNENQRWPIDLKRAVLHQSRSLLSRLYRARL